MSLILDALRKSEAERRRGQAPDLFAPAAAKIAPVGKQPVAVIVVALAALLAAATVVFWPGQPSRQPVSTSVADIAASPAHDNVVPVAPPITANTNNPTPKPRPVPSAETARSPVTEKPATSKPSAEISAVSSNPPAAIDNEAVAPLNPAAAAADVDTTDNEPALPTLATLDSATRATLPPLQLSMHVWNPDATRRFAIIDGQRLGEGGKLAGAVVAEIRRDGVVLDIGGRQFLLPRP
jgi:general secretion pathway protein B